MSKFKLTAHVASYSLIFGITVGSALIYVNYFGKSDEDKIKKMIEKNPSILKESTERREKMKIFFEKMKNKDKDVEDMFAETLKGGKFDFKRHHTYEGPPSAALGKLPSPSLDSELKKP